MTGETSAEMTAEPDGETGIKSTGENDTTPVVAAPTPSAEPVYVNGQAAADEPVAAADESTPAPAAAESEPPVAEQAPAAPEAEVPISGQPTAEQVPVASEQPAAERAAPDAEATSSEQPAAQEPAGAAQPAGPAIAVTPDTERPAVGPKILGVAAEPKPLPTVKATLPTRKRRRRPSAAERHRRAFFSALTELRRGGATPAQDAAPADEQAPGAAEAPAASGAATTNPATAEIHDAGVPAEQERTAQNGAPAAAEPSASAPEKSPPSPARVMAAIERVGGAEVIKEALKPKQDEKGQPLKWAAVCAQAAEGLKPGDPIFSAWVRLAATPVRDVKGMLPRPAEPERSQRGESAGRRPGGQRSGRGDRPRRDDRASRSEYASHAQDGTLRKSIRIVTGHDEDQERRERERNRKEQREAKRRAERERLARLGY